MKTIYQSLFYKTIVTGGIIVATAYLVKTCFLQKEFFPRKTLLSARLGY